MSKLRYEIDPHNRLIIKDGQKKTDVCKFRYIVEGEVRTEKGNTLLYHIKAPSDAISKQLNLPHQLKFKGGWSLTENHDLRLTLDKWRRQTFGDELTLKGEIIKIDAHSLIFAVTQKAKEGAISTYILKFEGGWQADKDNRLTFKMEREKGNYDVLVFDGAWEVNRNHKIVYNYEKRLTKRAEKKRRSLLFDGFWSLKGKDVLTYRLDLADKSAFDFRIGRGAIEKGAIKFEIGIGISQSKKPVKEEIILYGKWKLKPGTGLAFEITYGDNQIGVMSFEAEAKLIRDSKIRFALRNEIGKDLGISLTLSKTMLEGCGESFIRLLGSRKEKAIYIGAGFIW